jgi:hypothetical protein
MPCTVSNFAGMEESFGRNTSAVQACATELVFFYEGYG